MIDRLANFDFTAHNAEVQAMWAAFNAGQPTRTPSILGINTRYFFANPRANPGQIDFRRYSENPDVMFDCQLQFQRWSRFNLLQDAELGLPAKWVIAPDFQNYYEAAWFGCAVHYFDGQVPDTLPDFAAQPERVMEAGAPDPFAGLLAKVWRYYEHFQSRAATETYLDRPIEIGPPWCGIGTDGVLTVACNLFGPDFVCEAMAGEPDRLQRLLEFINTATIQRITAWRKRFNLPIPYDGFGYADDSIALISTPMYREHVLPHHRKLFGAFATEKPRSIHLCGDATRHFLTIRDELNVQCFDTGFPVDFGALRRELGPNVRLQGGPHVNFLLTARPPAVREDVRRIMTSDILEGGRFVLREGNNLAPGTPLENTEALYAAGKEFGKLR